MWLPKWWRNLKQSHTLPLLWRNNKINTHKNCGCVRYDFKEAEAVSRKFAALEGAGQCRMKDDDKFTEYVTADTKANGTTANATNTKEEPSTSRESQGSPLFLFDCKANFQRVSVWLCLCVCPLPVIPRKLLKSSSSNLAL